MTDQHPANSTDRPAADEHPAYGEELVVLLDDAGQATGTMPKALVHTDRTPLHLAFSLYAFDDDGRFLLTRRALDKATFPGVWTNTVCGHPAPGEDLTSAAARRVRTELGMTLINPRIVLPQFRYRAQMGGIVEHEICPVLIGQVCGPGQPDPAEVADLEWVAWEPFARAVRDGRRPVSVWCAEQVAQLTALGPDPHQWPTTDPALLPPALRTPPAEPPNNGASPATNRPDDRPRAVPGT